GGLPPIRMPEQSLAEMDLAHSSWPEVYDLSLQENLTRVRCQARARESYVLLRRFGPYRFSVRVTCSATARQLPGKADRSPDIDFALPMSPQAPSNKLAGSSGWPR